MEPKVVDAPAMLRGLLARVPVSQLLASPSVCRNALQDTFPDDSLVASVLAEAAAEGAVQRLLEADGAALAQVGPAIRRQLSERRGIAPDNAAWALAAWAVALGRVDGDVSPRPSPQPGAAELLFSGTRPAAAPPRRRAPATPAAATMVEGIATAIARRTAPTVVRPFATQPTVIRGRGRGHRSGRGPLLAVLIGLGAVVLVACGLVVALALPAPPVRLVPASDTALSVRAPHSTRSIVRSSGTLAVGSTVRAVRGPAELSVGGTAVRLDTGASLTYTAAAGFGRPAAMRLTAGRAYLSAPDGQRLDLATAAGTARVDGGRLVASCASTCTLQALDEAVAVQGSTSTTRLAAHQALVGTGHPVFAATDVLRANPWITQNLARDRAEHRARTTIAGRSLVGSWRFSMTRPDFPGPYVVSVTIAPSTGCTTTTCPLTATTDARGAVGRVHPRGTVRIGDSSGSRITVAYESVRAACDPLLSIKKQSDGSTALVDDLTLSGPGSGASEAGHGTRTATYAPAAGSVCTTPALTAIQWTVTAAHRARTASDVPEFKDEAQMLINFVRGGATGCARGDQGPTAGRWADLVCGYPAGGSPHPASIEYVNYKNRGPTTGDNVLAAYGVIARKAGVGPIGACSASPCTTALTDVAGGYFVQRVGSGSTRLVAYDTGPSDLMLIATGSLTPAQMISWFQAQHADERDASGAWSWTPILRTGF